MNPRHGVVWRDIEEGRTIKEIKKFFSTEDLKRDRYNTCSCFLTHDVLVHAYKRGKHYFLSNEITCTLTRAVFFHAYKRKTLPKNGDHLHLFITEPFRGPSSSFPLSSSSTSLSSSSSPPSSSLSSSFLEHSLLLFGGIFITASPSSMHFIIVRLTLLGGETSGGEKRW